MKYRIGIYVRVSTEEQAQLKEGSIETQKHRASLFIESKVAHEPKWGKVIDIYSDEGLSAKNTKRPAYQKMMTDVRSGRVNLILVTDLSRLSRNIMDFCVLLEELRKHSAKFLSIKEQFDTSTATGEMMVFNMINLAQFERKQTSERVTMNFHARALRGLTNGSPAPLGYKRNPERPGGLMVDELEATQVRRIFEVFLEEGSLKKTVAKLNVEGIRPKITANKSHFQAGRGKWTACGLLYLLRSPTYIGMRAVNRKHQHKDQSLLRSYEKFQLVKGAWPAIVDEIVFDEVQYELDKNRTRRALGPRGRNFPLTGILKCQECGDGFNGASAHGRGGVHRYYIHRDAYKRKIGCKIRRIRAGKTEEAILPSLGRIIHRLGYFETARGKVDELIGNRLEGLRPQEIRVKEELLRVDREIEHSLRLKKSEGGEFSLGDVILNHLKKLKDDRDNLEKTLLEIRRHMESAQKLNVDWDSDTALMSKFNVGWKSLKPFQQRRILHRVFKDIVVGAEGFRIVCWAIPKAQAVLAPAMEGRPV